MTTTAHLWSARRDLGRGRERGTGLVSGAGGETTAAPLDREWTSTRLEKTPSSHKRRRDVSDLEHESRAARESSEKIPKTLSATDMSWLEIFSDPSEAEGAADPDARGVAVAPGGRHGNVLGRTVQVFWPSEETWHAGRVLRYDPGSGKASVLYATGDIEQGVSVDALAGKGYLYVL